ncbi:hypothetical protein R6Q57_029447 [Mikania cordata]
MEGLIPFVMHAMKKHRLHKSCRSLSVCYRLLDGSVAAENRSEFQPPMAEYLQQRSGFGYDAQSMNTRKDFTTSTTSMFIASKKRRNASNILFL